MSTYDLFSPAFKANPFPTFAAMRERDPVFAHMAPDGRTIWYVTRYADVAEILKDGDRFCKDPRRFSASAAANRPHQLINQNMLFSDPPDHTRLRALVSQAFTPRRVAAMAGRIHETAEGLIDRMIREDRRDIIAAYALPLPVIVISDMLGIPAADRDDVAVWSQAIISPGSRGLNYSARKRHVRAFTEYLRDLFARRQADPQDDLITALVEAETDGQRLSEAELFSMVALLLVTGHETTVNLIGNGALALWRAPAQLERLRADTTLWPAAVEELLRYDGPVETSTSRWVRTDTTFGGRAMRRGDLMRAVIASANRDPAAFDRPDALDVGRSDNRHLAFGLGAHYCLGAPLARLEGTIALETLFRRLPQARPILSPAPAWRSGVLFRGLRELTVHHKWIRPSGTKAYNEQIIGSTSVGGSMVENANQGHVPLPPNVSLDRPSAARIYDYMLGGYHNFEIDRQAASRFEALFPDFSLTARVNRAFLRRAASFVAQQGIDQFLDLGSGIPTVGNVHEIVRQYQPEARTVYVDIEPMAVAHAELLLQDDPGTVAVLADVRRPADILDHEQTRARLDFNRPVGLFAVALLHYILDDDEAEQVIETFKDALSPGSYVVIGVWTYDDAPRDVMEKYAEMAQELTTPGAPRSREKVARYFRGLELLEPGIVHGPQWRPDGPDDLLLDEPGRAVNWVGVARKP